MIDAVGNPIRIRKIEIDEETGDVTFFFFGSEEPWSANEFDANTPTGNMLRAIEVLVGW